MSTGDGTELLALSQAGVIQDTTEAEVTDVPTRSSPDHQIMVIHIPLELQLMIFHYLVGDEIQINEKHQCSAEFLKEQDQDQLKECLEKGNQEQMIEDEPGRMTLPRDYSQEQENEERRIQDEEIKKRRHDSENILLIFPNLEVEGALQYSPRYGFYEKCTTFIYSLDNHNVSKHKAMQWKEFCEVSMHRLLIRHLRITRTNFQLEDNQLVHPMLRGFRRLNDVTFFLKGGVRSFEFGGQTIPLLEGPLQKLTEEYGQNRMWNAGRTGSAGAEEWSVPRFSIKFV